MITLPFNHALIADALSEIRREVQALRGLFRVQVDGKSFEMPVESYEWQPVAGVPGVEMCALPVAYWPSEPLPGADYFLSRGPAGVEQADLCIPQAIANEVLEGVLEFRKESAPAYVAYHPGEVFRLAPGECHGWHATTDFLCRIAFRPRLTQP